MEWGNIIGHFVFGIIMQTVLCEGTTTVTYYKNTYGTGNVDLRCARNAAVPGKLATITNSTGTCSGLSWDWGTSPSYISGSTYMEKKRVVTTYPSPLVIGRNLELPIMFTTGSYIDMYIEFTSDSFTYGSIYMMDTLDTQHDLYDAAIETVMVYMSLTPLSNAMMVKTFSALSWFNKYSGSYPFDVGPTHKVSFKALSSDFQVLINDVEIVSYPHVIPPENARMLFFTETVGMLLHKIDFVGV